MSVRICASLLIVFLFRSFQVSGQGEVRLLFGFNPDSSTTKIVSYPATAYPFTGFDLLDKSGSLFRTDYTQGGTNFLTNYEGTFIKKFVEADGVIYFIDETYHLWGTDGTADGTKKIRHDIKITDILKIGGAVISVDLAYGDRKLRRVENFGLTDIADLPQTSGFATSVDSLYIFINRNGRLMKTDGRAEGTEELSNETHGEVRSVAKTQSSIFFLSANNQLIDLWKLNFGSDSELIKVFNEPDVAKIFPRDENIWLAFHDVANNKEILWRSDGTTPGTVKVGEIATSSTIDRVESIEDKTIFYLDYNWYGVNGNGVELLAVGVEPSVLKGTNYFIIPGSSTLPWSITDGTLANTKPAGAKIIAYKVRNDSIVVVDDTSSGVLLKLVSDSEVTTIATLLPSNAGPRATASITTAADHYYVTAKRFDNGKDYVYTWKTDLTVSGTIPLVTKEAVTGETVLLHERVPFLLTHQMYCCTGYENVIDDVVLTNLNTGEESFYTGLDNGLGFAYRGFHGWNKLGKGWVSTQSSITNGETVITLKEPGLLPSFKFHGRLGEDLIFSAFMIPGGYKLWKTNGTTTGTKQFYEDGGGYVIQPPRLLLNKNDTAHYYVMSAPATGFEIFKFKQTGEVRQYDYIPGVSSGPFHRKLSNYPPVSIGEFDFFTFDHNEVAFSVFKAGPQGISEFLPKQSNWVDGGIMKISESKIAVLADTKVDIVDIKVNAVLKGVDTGVSRFTTNEGKIYTRNQTTASIASIDSLGSKTVLLTYDMRPHSAQFYNVGSKVYSTFDNSHLDGIDASTNTPLVLPGDNTGSVMGVASINESLVFLSGKKDLVAIRSGSAEILGGFNNPLTEVKSLKAFKSGRHLFYFITTESKLFLWKTDATSAGTSLIAEMDFQCSSLDYYLNVFQAKGGFFITSSNPCSTNSLWYYDGTSEGVSKVVDQNTSALSGVPFKEDFIFTTTDGKLWIYDVPEPEIVLGVESTESSPFYPNPASDYFITGLDEAETLEIFDSIGNRVLYLSNVVGPIDVRSVRAGLYHVRATSRGKSVTSKIIILH